MRLVLGKLFHNYALDIPGLGIIPFKSNEDENEYFIKLTKSQLLFLKKQIEEALNDKTTDLSRLQGCYPFRVKKNLSAKR